MQLYVNGSLENSLSTYHQTVTLEQKDTSDLLIGAPSIDGQ